MNTLFIKIFIILQILSYAFSQITVQASNISICPLGQINKLDEKNCFKYSSEDVKCCILKILRDELSDLYENVCWGFKSDNIQDIYNYNGFNYKVFCEEKFNNNEIFNENYSAYVDESHLKTCGVPRPETLSDCTSLSDDTGSCCLYTYNDIKQCTKLGKRFDGVQDYGALRISCFSTFINNNFVSFIILIFFVFFDV